MSLSFSDRPGPRERQLRRRHGNPLFGVADGVDPEQLRQAKLADQAEARAFEQSFPALIERAVNLPPTAESDQVLALKEDLDKAYEQAAGLAGDQVRLREAINKLIGVIMQAVWKGAGNDSALCRNSRGGTRYTVCAAEDAAGAATAGAGAASGWRYVHWP